MDFAVANKEALDYVSKAGCSFKITSIDEANSQIHLASHDNGYSFYVSCPNSENSSWNVWSDSENSQQALQYVMDSCDLDSCKTVSAVLEIVSKHLQMASQKKTNPLKATASANRPDAEDEDEENEDEDLNSYYDDEDFDAENDQTTKQTKEKEEEEKLVANFFNSKGSETAVNRLVKDLKVITRESTKFGIEAAPHGNNLFMWNVKLTDIPTDTQLGRDLGEYAKLYKVEPVITLDMQFPSDYPFSPPFIRVVKPRFKFLTGHITVGGSICMQMLTKSGWRPTNDIESILVQVRTEILSDPKAGLDMSAPNREYSESEAKSAFHRMVQKYGW